MYSLKLFTAGKTEVYFHASALFIFSLFWVNIEELNLLSFLDSTFICCGLFASILFHEFAHIAVANKYGLPCKQVYLHAFGGAAAIEGLEHYERERKPYEEFWIAFAGPFSSFLLAVIFFVGLVLMPSGPTYLGKAWFYFVKVNIVIGVFNLIPVYPIDGGRMIRSIFNQKRDLLGATKYAYSISLVVGTFLSAWALYSGVYHIPILFALLFLITYVEIRHLKASKDILELEEEIERLRIQRDNI